MRIASNTKLSQRIASFGFAFVLALSTVTGASSLLFAEKAEALAFGQTQLRASSALPTTISHGDTTCFSVKQIAGLGGNAWTDINTQFWSATITATVSAGEISTPASAVVTIPAGNKTVQGTFCYKGTVAGNQTVTLKSNVPTIGQTIKNTLVVPVVVNDVPAPTDLRLNGSQPCGYFTNINQITPTWNAVSEAVSYNYIVTLPGGATYGPVNVGNVTSVTGPFGAEGISSFSVQSVNANGYVSAWAPACDVAYDITNPSSTHDLGDFVTGPVTVTQTVSDNLAAQSGKLRIWKLKNDGSQDETKFFAIGDVAVNGANKVVYNFGPNNLHGDGKYLAKFTATDKAGNASVVEKKFTVDTTGPTITVQASAQGDATRNIFREVGFNFYDANKVDYITINNVVKNLSDSTYSNVDKIGSPHWYGAVEGTNTLVAYDVLGNSSTLTFTIDRTAPTATLAYSNNNGNNLTKNDVTVTLTANEDVQDIAGWTRTGTSNTFTKVFTANGSFSVTLVDLAGNTFVKSGEVKRIDRNAPTISGVANGALVNVPVILSIFDPKYQGYDGYSEVNGLKVNGVTVATTPAAGKTYLATISADGTYTVVATDKAGNASAAVTFTIDSTAPIVTAGDIATTVFGNTANVSGTVNDPTISTVEVFVDGGSVGTASVVAGEYSFNLVGLSVGQHNVAVSAVDAAGNEGISPIKTATVNAAPVVVPASINNGPATLAASPAAQPNANVAVVDTVEDEEVLGASTENTPVDEKKEVLASTTTPEIKESGKVLGLDWYWWLPILAAGAGATWWLIAFWRRRGEEA